MAIDEKQVISSTSTSTPPHSAMLDTEKELGSTSFIDVRSERAYVRKLDFVLLPFLSLMYFFNSVDRSNLGNAKTDGMDKDLHFIGEEYSLLILLFYVPFGLCDLPLNMLTNKFSGRVMLPTLMVSWGAMALLQCAASNFAGLLVIRLLLGFFEAGFFAGVVFYFTLFYTRGELGFRIAIFFGSALLAAAFSGLISFGVFQINDRHVPGWKWLFIIEGGLTVIVAIVAFWWLPASPATAWFLTDEEKAAARARGLRDSSGKVGSEFSVRESFASWKTWKFFPWVIISFTYPVAFATTSNFLPLVCPPHRFILLLSENPLTLREDRSAPWLLYCQDQSLDCCAQRRGLRLPTPGHV